MIDPIDYPKITIAGREVEVKFRCGDAIQLYKQYGIDLWSLKVPAATAERAEWLLRLLAAGIAHAGSTSVEELSNSIGIAQLNVVDKVIAEALKKARAEIVASADDPSLTI